MAKTAKLKKSSKPSTHSRASRRASSPSLQGNLDKSLTNAPRPPSTKPSILAPQSGSGVSKVRKKKGAKILKRKQKQRVEQGKERAEAMNEKLERKVARAEQMREGKKGRNADWDELNEKISGRRKSKKDKSSKEDDGWEDEDMEVDGDARVASDEQINMHQIEPTEEGPQAKDMRVGIPNEADDSIS